MLRNSRRVISVPPYVGHRTHREPFSYQRGKRLQDLHVVDVGLECVEMRVGSLASRRRVAGWRLGARNALDDIVAGARSIDELNVDRESHCFCSWVFCRSLVVVVSVWWWWWWWCLFQGSPRCITCVCFFARRISIVVSSR